MITKIKCLEVGIQEFWGNSGLDSLDPFLVRNFSILCHHAYENDVNSLCISRFARKRKSVNRGQINYRTKLAEDIGGIVGKI